MDLLTLVLIAIGLVSGLIAILRYLATLSQREHIDILTIVIALLSSLFLGVYLYLRRPQLPFFFSGLSVCLGAVFFAGTLLICGELFLRRAALQPSVMGKKFLWFTIPILLLSSVPFWMTWAWGPITSTNPAAVTLQAYCQALVDKDFARAVTYFSSSTKGGSSVLSAAELARHVQTDIVQAGNLRACSSTASDSVTSNGASYAGGSVIYSFRPGVWYFKSYHLFQGPSSSTWLIDTDYWKDPHALGVY